MRSLDRFLAALAGEAVDRPPAWLMRQAGRTLPEYRSLKDRYSFAQLYRTPELALEVTLQPLRRLPVDAAILFSDILVVPEAMGVEVTFHPAPVLSPVIASRADLERLRPAEPHETLGFVAETLALLRREVGSTHAILGFSGAPFTLACYMVDGVGSKGFPRTMAMMHRDPDLFLDLLHRLTDAVEAYLRMQLREGITAYQLFDTWAELLSPEGYARFARPFVRRIVEALAPQGVPSIYYLKGAAHLLPEAAGARADVLSVDWRVSLARVRQVLGSGAVVQGNLDPATLHAPPAVIREAVGRMLDMTGGRGHIVNLGHGLTPDIPLEGVEAFLDAVAAWAEARP
ncbi:MAG: uroporphyrinogen decarboxylase [Deltaproteobacteria bacterium]|nr:uroporphyrinogen decarboxylase [Deltaproteobacteria bacterium]